MAHCDGVSCPMITAEQRDRLYQFFAGYFHEDWAQEASSPDEILASFTRRHAADERELLSRTIVAFVDDHPGDDELDEALFNDLGCYYSPRGEGRSTRTWLLSVALTLDPSSSTS